MANKKTNNKIKKQANKIVKKISIGGVVAILLCLVVGAIGGVVALKVVTKNDTFELNGTKEFKYDVGDEITYTEEGYKVVSFGRDLTDKVEIKTNLKQNDQGVYYIENAEEGEYFIIYTVNSKKYGKVQKFRTFVVGDSNE